MWKQVTVVGFALCLAWTGWELSHHHEEHPPAKTSPSMHIRCATERGISRCLAHPANAMSAQAEASALGRWQDGPV